MEQENYNPQLPNNPLPKSPHQMTNAELDKEWLDSQQQQERQHRELRSRMDSLVSSQKELKTSVDQLARTRRIEWAILIVGGIAAIAAVVELFRAH